MSEMSLLAIILLISILVVILLHSCVLSMEKRWFFFDPLNTFWAGILVCYVLQPISHGNLFLEWHGEDTLEKTFFWILLGLVFIVIGYERDIGVKWGESLPKMPQKLVPSRLFIYGCLLVGLGMLGFAYLMASAGGVSYWLSVGRGGTDWNNVSGYLAEFQDLLLVGLSLLLFHVELHTVIKSKRIFTWCLGGVIWLWYVYLGTRSHTIACSVVMLAAYYIPRRKNPPVVLLAGVFLLLLILSSFQGLYRGQFTNLSFNTDRMNIEEVKRQVLPTWLGGDAAAHSKVVQRGIEFNCVMTIIDLVPDRIDYNYGYGFLEIFTRPIPRSIWPDKVYPQAEALFPILYDGGLSSTWIPRSKKPLLMGPAFTFIGYWYAVGGALALIIAGFFTGCLFRMIRTIFDRAPGSEGDLILFSNLIMIGFSEAAATPLVWIYSLPIALLFILVIMYICRDDQVQDTI